MRAKKANASCVVCNPDDAQSGEYCESHQEQLHHLNHQYETLFRLVRTSRGKDHEILNLFLRGECEPSGRILVHETDPENLAITILVAEDLHLDAPLADYSSLKIEKTHGDYLREKIENEIIRSWYGNARACVDVFRTRDAQPQHWDVAPREDQAEEEFPEEPDPSDKGGKHSVH